MEKEIKNIPEKENNVAEQKLDGDFQKLQKIVEVLRNMGFTIMDHLITKEILKSPTAFMGFPLVSDGANGIRASYSKDEGLKVWFTNGFESLANSQRQEEVKKRLEEEGLQ